MFDKKLLDDENHRIYLSRAIKLIKQCDVADKNLILCGELCKEFNLNRTSEIFGSSLDMIKNFLDNFKDIVGEFLID